MRRTRVLLAGLAAGAISATGAAAVSGAPSNVRAAGTSVSAPQPSKAFWANYNRSMRKAAEDAPAPKLQKRDREKLKPSADRHRGPASHTETRRLIRSIAPQLVSNDAVVPNPDDVAEALSPTALRMKARDGRSGGVMVSNLPMATRAKSTGRGAAFDLVNIDWQASGGRFEVKDPYVPVSIAETAGGRVQIGDSITLRLTDADRTAEGSRSGEAVTYSSIARDTDMVVRSLPTGVQVGWLLRSPDAEQELRVPLELLDGQKLQSSPNGSVQIVGEDGMVVGEVSSASAVDADHVAVPLITTLEGSTIVYRVAHDKGGVKYPIVVDPQVADVHWDNGSVFHDLNDGWFSQNTPSPNEPYQFGRQNRSSSGRGQLAILGPQQAGYSQTAAGAWARFAPGDPTYGTTQAGTTRRVSPEHGYWYRFDAGALAYSVYPSKTEHYYNYPASVVEFLSRDGVADTRSSWALLDANGNPGAANSGLMFNKLPNGTNGTSAAVWLGSSPTDSARSGNGSNSYDNVLAFGLNQISPYYYWQYEHPLAAIGMGWYRAYTSDTVAPAVDTTAPGSGTWQTAPPATIPVTASDRGMGVKAVQLERTADSVALATPSSPPTCSSYSYTVCQFTWAGGVAGTSIPQGRSTARLRATDGDGLQTTRQLSYAIDASAPTAAPMTGDLFTKRASALTDGRSRSLTISATDGTYGGSPSQVQSGVQTIVVRLDGNVVKTETQTNGADSAPLTTSWTAEADAVPLGQHTVTVTVTDRVGRVAPITTFTFERQRAGVGEIMVGSQGGSRELSPDWNDNAAAFNPFNGNLVLHEVDLPIDETVSSVDAGILGVDRWYSSNVGDTSTSGMGWTLGSGTDVRLTFPTSSKVRLTGPAQRVVTFSASGTTWASDAAGWGLTKNGTTWIVSNGPGQRLLSFTEGGRLERISDQRSTASSGSEYTGTAAAEQLSAVNGSNGVRFPLSYTGSQLTSVAKSPTETGAYEYTGGLLSAVRRPTGVRTQYGYFSDGRLASVSRPGYAIQATYDSRGRVVSLTETSDGDTSTVSVDYRSPQAGTCDGAGVVLQTDVSVTGETGKASYCFDNAGALKSTIYPPEETLADEPESADIGTAGYGAEPSDSNCGIGDDPNTDCNEDALDNPVNQAALAEGNTEIDDDDPNPVARAAPVKISSALAKKGPGWGLADQNSNLFGFGADSPLGGGQAAPSPFESELTDLKVKRIRYAIAWSAVLRRDGPLTVRLTGPKGTTSSRKATLKKDDYAFQVADNYIKLAQARGIEVTLTVDRTSNGGGKESGKHILPTEKQYKDAVVAIHREWPTVKYIGSWNEMNGGLEPLRAQPEVAGRFWKILNSYCKSASVKCTAIAGDFVDTAIKSEDSGALPPDLYLPKFIKNAGYSRTSPPVIWGLHGYESGRRRTLKRMTAFADVTKCTGCKYTPKIWLTEQGGMFHKYKNRPGVDDTNSPAIEDAKYTVRELRKASTRLTRFYYYQMQGDPTGFDSGLKSVTTGARRSVYDYVRDYVQQP